MKVTNEELERAAIAIWDAEEQAHSPGDMMPWSEAGVLVQSGYLRSARAALATLSCPTCGLAAEALEPFAQIYDLNVPLPGKPDFPDDDLAIDHIPDTAVSWGELRRAASALAKIKEGRA